MTMNYVWNTCWFQVCVVLIFLCILGTLDASSTSTIYMMLNVQPHDQDSNEPVPLSIRQSVSSEAFELLKFYYQLQDHDCIMIKEISLIGSKNVISCSKQIPAIDHAQATVSLPIQAYCFSPDYTCNKKLYMPYA